MNEHDTFDLERLRVTGDAMPSMPKQSERPPRHKPGEKFLKGPIPWEWIVRAGQLPGSAMVVGLILWREAGLVNRRDVQFCLSKVDAFSKSVGAARYGLRSLKSAGLITVRHRPGRCLDVTILDVASGKRDQSPDDEREEISDSREQLDAAWRESEVQAGTEVNETKTGTA